MTTVAVDSHSLIFRSFYAAQASRSDDPAVALNIFRRLITSLLPALNPGYVLAACDRSGPTFRHRLAPSYKAQRKPAPDGLKQVIPAAINLLRDAGVPVLSAEDFEADDVIATLAGRMRPGHRLIVVSSDRDLVSLVNDRTDLLLVGSAGKHRRVTHADARDIFGVHAGQVVDFKALVGDSSDNIPGVAGIGPKTAVALLSEHGSLDGILDARDRLPGRVAAKLDEDGIARARLCRSLAQLRGDVPVVFDAAEARWTTEKLQRLRGDVQPALT